MSKAITPQHAIDILVLETLEVLYAPTWDGANWVIDPADVWLVCEGHIGSGGNEVDKITHKFKASDLPAAGKTAMNALYNHLETKMAALYP